MDPLTRGKHMNITDTHQIQDIRQLSVSHLMSYIIIAKALEDGFFGHFGVGVERAEKMGPCTPWHDWKLGPTGLKVVFKIITCDMP